MPVSLPTPRPQPDASSYPLTELNLFDRLTRAIYKEKYGEQAPVWDKNRRIQRWFDSSAAALPPDEPYIIEYYAQVGGVTMRRKTVITNAEAATPNLPGRFDYPKYVPAPSGAWTDILDSLGKPTGARRYLSNEDLSHYIDAVMIAQQLQSVKGVDSVSDPFETVMGGPYAYRFDETESRRFWNLRINGDNVVSVGRLLKAKYAFGVGAPGRWICDNNYVQWVSDIPVDVGERDLRPEVPIPQRPLKSNERIIEGSPFSGPLVERTDKSETIAKDDAAAMPGRVAEILKRVTAIQEALKA